MVREIIKDQTFLAKKSVDATKEDAQLVRDLQDTLRAHLEECVGMAANMIGENKNIIVYVHNGFVFAMINPVIIDKQKPYETEEGCLSLDGVRPCTRYEEIEVEYIDRSWNQKRSKFSGFTAEIIQHEIDHLHGILI